mmetsp:Transcript_30845/g.89730  ORF Transcript_30845/g.89730 Transcript_30845/m.89730 type:complete len:200 (+) Transcript_30845:415-1014(+)
MSASGHGAASAGAAAAASVMGVGAAETCTGAATGTGTEEVAIIWSGAIGTATEPANLAGGDAAGAVTPTPMAVGAVMLTTGPRNWPPGTATLACGRRRTGSAAEALAPAKTVRCCRGAAIGSRAASCCQPYVGCDCTGAGAAASPSMPAAEPSALPREAWGPPRLNVLFTFCTNCSKLSLRSPEISFSAARGSRPAPPP